MAVEKRIAQLTSMMKAPRGFTNPQRKAFHRERNILHRWLAPDVRTEATTRRKLNRLRNQRRRLIAGENRRPTKRECREARRQYREQHIQPVAVRPDYVQPVICTEDERQRLIRSRERILKKHAWFERKYSSAS